MPRIAQPLRILALFGGVVKLGSERGNLEALSALKDKGAEVLLLVSDAPWAAEIRHYVSEKGFVIRPCPYLVLPRPGLRMNPWLNYPGVIARASHILLKELLRFRPTHIHISSQLFALNFLPCLAFSSTPILYRCGDKPVAHNRLFRAIWWFLTRRANRFVAVSHFIARELQESGVAADRITVIYSRPPTRSAQRDFEQLNSERKSFQILFAGQINEAKGSRLLIAAFRRIAASYPTAQLLLAGRISDWEGDAWARALRDETLRDEEINRRVRFLGFVEDIPGLMAQCDLNVIPTLTEEPLANVVFEAKQAGIPSIVFPSGGLPETIDHGIDGYICSDKTVASLAQALDYYLSDPQRAETQGRAAQASLSSFGIDEFADQWVSAYEAARSSHPRKARPEGLLTRPAANVSLSE